MSPRNVLESQQSVHADLAGRSAAGCWKLAAGRAVSLHPRQRSVLEIAQGRVWLTVSHGRPWYRGRAATATVVDRVLLAGERMAVEPGQHMVVEAWSPMEGAGSAGTVAFRWEQSPAAVAALSLACSQGANSATGTAASAAKDWECGVVQPLRDLLHALGQGGRAVGTALADMAQAGGRFAAGLARFALHRIAAPLTRKPA